MLYPKSKEPELSKALFRNPTKEYRGTPFWAWNCELDQDELLWLTEAPLMNKVTFELKADTNFYPKDMFVWDVDFPKEKVCYVAKDCAEELKKARSSSTLEKTYQLPDGETIKIDCERFLCPEALFDPSLIIPDTFYEGIHLTTYKSIMKCKEDIRNDIFKKIVFFNIF